MMPARLFRASTPVAPTTAAERADRGQPHHHRQDLEDQALEDRDRPDDRFAALAHRLHREADQQGLPDLPGGDRAEQ
jgi:hypothetical protein